MRERDTGVMMEDEGKDVHCGETKSAPTSQTVAGEVLVAAE